MCGRYTLGRSSAELLERFAVTQSDLDLKCRYNVAPSQEIPAIILQDGATRLVMFKWGLIPFWAKDPRTAKPMINARGETLTEKPYFTGALEQRRCLIPADGFYEWKAENKVRTPLFIQRQDRALFAFAGLWDTKKQADGSLLRTCAIVTVEPNALLATIHNRMPTLLHIDDEKTWVDCATYSTGEALAVLQPCPANELVMYPVSRAVNSPRIDSPELVIPVICQKARRL